MSIYDAALLIVSAVMIVVVGRLLAAEIFGHVQTTKVARTRLAHFLAVNGSVRRARQKPTHFRFINRR